MFGGYIVFDFVDLTPGFKSFEPHFHRRVFGSGDQEGGGAMDGPQEVVPWNELKIFMAAVRGCNCDDVWVFLLLC